MQRNNFRISCPVCCTVPVVYSTMYDTEEDYTPLYRKDFLISCPMFKGNSLVPVYGGIAVRKMQLLCLVWKDYMILLYSQTKGVKQKYILCISGLVAYRQYIHNCSSLVDPLLGSRQ